MANSTTRKKFSKPHPDFPLWPHPSGRWCKKIRGRFHYFGSVQNDLQGQAALERWLDQKDDLLAGRKPREKGDGLTVRELANAFLTSKRLQADSGEIQPRTWEALRKACSRVIQCFGRNQLVDALRPDDFQRLRGCLNKTMGLRTLKAEMSRIRALFGYAVDADLIDRPVKFGPAFRTPSKRALEKQRLENGPRMFEAAEIRTILDAANPFIRAAVFLGINCGCGRAERSMPAASKKPARQDTPGKARQPLPRGPVVLRRTHAALHQFTELLEDWLDRALQAARARQLGQLRYVLQACRYLQQYVGGTPKQAVEAPVEKPSGLKIKPDLPNWNNKPRSCLACSAKRCRGSRSVWGRQHHGAPRRRPNPEHH